MRLVKMAIQSSVEKGSRNAIRGMSDFFCGAARKETPLKKYGTLKSMTSLRVLETLSAAKDMCAVPDAKSPTMPLHFHSTCRPKRISLPGKAGS